MKRNNVMYNWFNFSKSKVVWYIFIYKYLFGMYAVKYIVCDTDIVYCMCNYMVLHVYSPKIPPQS